jgi:hypothetical protein
MTQLTINHSNGNSTVYNLFNKEKQLPIAYHADTNISVVNALESARVNRQRIRIYLGDTTTGKCWNEEHDIAGYVGLSKGKDAYFPILVHNERSFGGGSLLDNCIIKIKESKGKRVLFQSNNFQQPQIDIKEGCGGYQLFIDGELYSNHQTLKSAEILKKKLS